MCCIAVAVVVAVLFWPVTADEVNEPVEEDEATMTKPATIAWVKFDAYFDAEGPERDATADSDDFSFKEVKVSKGKYHGKGTDLPTQSIWRLLSLKWGGYTWSIIFHLTGPGNTNLNDTQEFDHDLPIGKSTQLWDGSGIFYISQPGTYTITVELRALKYGAKELDGSVLATGRDTFTIPAEWAS